MEVGPLEAESQVWDPFAETQPLDAPPGGLLGKNEFLQLLITQMQNQDPMDPMDSRDSIAQLAQFSALEQMQNVGAQIEGLRQSAGLTDGLLLQGQDVEARGTNGVMYTGVIERVFWGKNGMMLEIGGETVEMSNLAELRLTSGFNGDAMGTGDAPLWNGMHEDAREQGDAQLW
jgi:flagellar basal-body rod modification protein FlgD